MKKKILVLVAVLFSFIMLVNAEEAEPVVTIGAEEKQNTEILYADDNVNVGGIQDSSQFVFGNSIKINSQVAGAQFSAGNSLDINGTTEYGFYAGNMITINSNISKDLFAAASTINIGSDAVLGRDVYLAAASIKINANVGRDLRVGAGTIDISGITINGDAYLDVDEIIMDAKTVITGKLSYVKDTKLVGKDAATIGSIEEKEKSDFGKVEITFASTISSCLIGAAGAIIVAIVLFYMIPSMKKKLDEEELTAGRIGSNLGKGIAALFLIPIISLIAIVTGIFTPLGLIMLAIYVIGIYLASIVSGYIIGRLLMTNIFKNDNQYLAIITGILLIRLLGLVPIASGIVTVICLLYGLGLLYNLIKKKN